jgi:hypothetical protein
MGEDKGGGGGRREKWPKHCMHIRIKNKQIKEKNDISMSKSIININNIFKYIFFYEIYFKNKNKFPDAIPLLSSKNLAIILYNISNLLKKFTTCYSYINREKQVIWSYHILIYMILTQFLPQYT